jgi:hypothetical protein
MEPSTSNIEGSAEGEGQREVCLIGNQICAEPKVALRSGMSSRGPVASGNTGRPS